MITRIPYLEINSILYQNPTGYHLSEGDIIKLGRLRLKVRKIFIKEHNIDNSNNKILNPIIANDNVCRICYSNQTELNNPLIHPCQCSGSVRFIHLICLHKWLISKIAINQKGDNQCQIYTLKPVQCELCKAFLPDFYKENNTLYELFDFSNSQFTSYITLETLLSNKYLDKVIYKINLQSKKSIKLGRGAECECRLIDITISRLHAYLTVSNNNIYLCNNNAKFGCLVLVQCKEIPLLPYQSITIQFGRSLITFNQSKAFWSSFFCWCCDKKSIDYYHQMNSKQIDFEHGYIIKKHNDNEQNNYNNDNKEKPIPILMPLLNNNPQIDNNLLNNIDLQVLYYQDNINQNDLEDIQIFNRDML